MLGKILELFPAIDILNGRAVRLLHGKKQEVTDYGLPLEAALRFKDDGAKNLHIVDLDGAFGGGGVSDSIIEGIVKKTGLFVQSGGGLRTKDDIDRRFDCGVGRVILGTVCYADTALFEWAISKYGDKIAAGIDAKDGYLAIKGWTAKTEEKALDFALKIKDKGISTIIFTDISKDGALGGVNYESTVEIAQKSQLNTIASGGMKSIGEIKRLRQGGIHGAILGRSVYTGDIDLKNAVKEAYGV